MIAKNHKTKLSFLSTLLFLELWCKCAVPIGDKAFSLPIVHFYSILLQSFILSSFLITNLKENPRKFEVE